MEECVWRSALQGTTSQAIYGIRSYILHCHPVKQSHCKHCSVDTRLACARTRGKKTYYYTYFSSQNDSSNRIMTPYMQGAFHLLVRRNSISSNVCLKRINITLLIACCGWSEQFVTDKVGTENWHKMQNCINRFSN